MNTQTNSLYLQRTTARKGFTLVELIVIVAIIAVIALGIGAYIRGGTDAANAAVGRQNAKAMSEMIQSIESLGGDVSVGGTDVDTTSMTTIVNSLRTETIITMPDGTEIARFQMDEEPTPASYTYSAANRRVTYNGGNAQP